MPLVFNDIDNADIQEACHQGGRIWYNPILDRLKRKIKDHFLETLLPKCCYCSRPFVGEFRLVVDIEHVLPQRHFGSERFIVQNLNIACKRCNMSIKKDDISFLENTLTSADYYNPIHYKIIHPNLDIYSRHLQLKSFRVDDDLYLNKYLIKTQDKGLLTYNYFSLKNLEIDSVSKSQGIKEKQELTSQIRAGIRNALVQILTKI